MITEKIINIKIIVTLFFLSKFITQKTFLLRHVHHFLLQATILSVESFLHFPLRFCFSIPSTSWCVSALKQVSTSVIYSKKQQELCTMSNLNFRDPSTQFNLNRNKGFFALPNLFVLVSLLINCIFKFIGSSRSLSAIRSQSSWPLGSGMNPI